MTLGLPDGEVISHSYDAGGNLNHIAGQLRGNVYAYLENLTYDEFEQRRSMTLGNGIKTRYHYNPQHRRLCRLESGLTLNSANSTVEACETFPREINSAEEQGALATQMRNLSAATGQFQNMHYAYDRVGNILGLGNAINNRCQRTIVSNIKKALEELNFNLPNSKPPSPTQPNLSAGKKPATVMCANSSPRWSKNRT